MKEDTTAKVAETTTKSGCEEGKEARDAAASASDNSDKLFHLRKALRLCPNSAETHYDLGKAYLNMDRAADANYEFKQALSIDPSYKAAQESLKDLDQGKTHY
jgi:Flp pilus assembly protein TadD